MAHIQSPRHRRAEIAEKLRTEIPIAQTYQMYGSTASDEQINLLEKTLKKLKWFLWFLSKLDWTQFLHFMNDACLKPSREESLKPQLSASLNPVDGSFSETALTSVSEEPTKGKKKRFRRSRAS